MNEYTKRFDLFGINCAQVLLSGHDLLNETCSSNIKNTFDFFFQNNIVAIVNENDVVATEELRKNGVFTDNDSLASLIATQIRADLLVILTKTNGLIGRDGVVLSEFNSISQLLVMGSKSSGGRGGIDSKIKAIINASSKGCDVFVSGKGSFCGFSSGLAKGTMTRKNSFLDKGGSIKIP